MKTMLQRRRGGALVMVIMAAAVLGVLGASYWRHLHSRVGAARLAAHEASALALAEAGIAHAVVLLRSKGDLPSDLPLHPLGDGHYRVRFERAADGSVQIESVGSLGFAHEPLNAQTLRAQWAGGALHYTTEGR